jgi:hypothetical protein
MGSFCRLSSARRSRRWSPHYMLQRPQSAHGPPRGLNCCRTTSCLKPAFLTEMGECIQATKAVSPEAVSVHLKEPITAGKIRNKSRKPKRTTTAQSTTVAICGYRAHGCDWSCAIPLDSNAELLPFYVISLCDTPEPIQDLVWLLLRVLRSLVTTAMSARSEPRCRRVRHKTTEHKLTVRLGGTEPSRRTKQVSLG